MLSVSRFCSVLVASAALLSMAGCGGSGGSSSSTPPVPLTITLGASSIAVPQDGTQVTLPVTIAGGSSTYTENVTGLPAGVTDTASTSGTLTFTGSASAAAGTYTGTVSVTSGSQSASKTFTLISAPVAVVSANVDTSLGVNGVMQQFMSTSFQPDEYDDAFFTTGAAQKETTLTQLLPQHIRLQAVGQGVPMVSNTGTASDWNFTVIDTVVQPVLAVADHSPEFQVAVAPTWMLNSAGHLDIDNHLSDFAAYAANLVRYYNKGGFDVAGTHFQSPSANPIHWWGVFNEYNINGVTAAQYVKLYNAVAPAMLAVDPSIQFSALEFSDFGLGTGDSGDPQQFLPAFFAPATAGGVNAPVGIVSTHFYASCNQTDPDTSLFAAIPQFVASVQYFQSQTATRPDLGKMPVWVTENNVNADYDNNGQSACNPGQAFVTDQRGTSAFFAAWRPYDFSQLGKAGNQALYHWDYDADPQFGEVDYNTGNTYLSYWVDQALATYYSSNTAQAGPSILNLNTTETADVEVLATKASDNTVVIMVVDRAVHAATDNNGTGDPRTVVVDVSALSGYSSATELTFDAGTNVATGATPVTVPLATRIPVTLNGYGVTFLVLHP